MEPNERQPGTRNECGQALQKFQRAHHQMSGAIAIRGVELNHDLTGWCTASSFVAQGRAREVATEPFEFLRLLGCTRRLSIQA